MPIRSAVIRRLIAELAAEDDADRRRLLAAQIESRYEHDMSEQADALQAQVSAIQFAIEDQIKAQFGATNEMIMESVALAREGGSAVVALRADFQSFMERSDDRFLDMERRLNEHDAILDEFRQSRDQSIEDRAQLFAHHEQSHADRLRIWQAIRDQDNRHSRQWQEISDRLAALERTDHRSQEP